MAKTLENFVSGFSKLNRNERFQRLLEMGVLKEDDISFLNNGGLKDFELAEHCVENVIGYYQLPVGVATNFIINGKEYIIPMAVEETSIIAAASKTAKWIRSNGTITTKVIGKNIIGQIQIAKVNNIENCTKALDGHNDEMIAIANSVLKGLVARGGGVSAIDYRLLDREDGSQDKMLILHVYCDPCEAMGANLINQACEALKPYIESITNEKVSMCILSNLVDTKLTVAEVRIKNIDLELAKGIEEASRFSLVDPYRAATNNKGVLNGIDPIIIATGNDWRAVEAGIHAYAAKSGKYKSITEWKLEGDELLGRFEAPLIVGTVGGVTRIHPMAQMSLRMMAVESSNELAGIMAAVGLVQNLGALKALSTVGIVNGHMKLHAANLALAAGAKSADEIAWVKEKLQKVLEMEKRISVQNATEALDQFRNERESDVSDFRA